MRRQDVSLGGTWCESVTSISSWIKKLPVSYCSLYFQLFWSCATFSISVFVTRGSLSTWTTDSWRRLSGYDIPSNSIVASALMSLYVNSRCFRTESSLSGGVFSVFVLSDRSIKGSSRDCNHCCLSLPDLYSGSTGTRIESDGTEFEIVVWIMRCSLIH